MRFLRRFYRTFRTAWRIARFSQVGTDWSESDSEQLTSFLVSAAGIHLQQKVINHVLEQSQLALSGGASPFAAGTIHGMKELWVSIGALTSAGVAPETDTEDEYEKYLWLKR